MWNSASGEGVAPQDRHEGSPAPPESWRNSVLPAARRARGRADPRGSPPLQPAPDHSRRRHDRSEEAEERARSRDRCGRSGFAGPALSRGRRGRHARRRRLRHRRRVQPAAPDHPRPVRHRQAEGDLGEGVDRRGEPAGERRRARDPAGQRQRDGHLRPVRPDRRRHRQLRHPVPGERRRGAVQQAVRLGLDLPLRGSGQRVLGRARPAVPRPVPVAAAARDGAVVRRGWRARGALRLDRFDHGHRGDQVDHRDRRAADRPADGVRRTGDELQDPQAAQGSGRESRSPS